MSDFITAVNADGRKQVIPAHWLDHPSLGAGFRLPPSAHPTPGTTPTTHEAAVATDTEE